MTPGQAQSQVSKFTKYAHSQLRRAGLAKSPFGFFHNILWKNSQPVFLANPIFVLGMELGQHSKINKEKYLKCSIKEKEKEGGQFFRGH